MRGIWLAGLSAAVLWPGMGQAQTAATIEYAPIQLACDTDGKVLTSCEVRRNTCPDGKAAERRAREAAIGQRYDPLPGISPADVTVTMMYDCAGRKDFLPAPLRAIPPVAEPTPAAPSPGFPVIRPVWLSKPSGDDLVRFYPPAALEAGLEGQATIACSVSEEGRLTDCGVVAEAPVGNGFGQATVALADRFRMASKTADGQPTAGGKVKITVRWNLGEGAPPPKDAAANSRGPGPVTRGPPQLVAPNQITRPDWIGRPSSEDLEFAYPPEAKERGVEGYATIQCTVTEAGNLTNCFVVEEAPVDAGFGAASLRVTGAFRMRPLQIDGRPVAGGVIRTSVIWKLEGAEPLQGPVEIGEAVAGLGPRSWRVAGLDRGDYVMALQQAALESAGAAGLTCPNLVVSSVGGDWASPQEQPVGVKTSSAAANLIFVEKLKVRGCAQERLPSFLVYLDSGNERVIAPLALGNTLAGPRTLAEARQAIAETLAKDLAKVCGRPALDTSISFGSTMVTSRAPDPWIESWPVAACGRNFRADLRFMLGRDGERPTYAIQLMPAFEPVPAKRP